MAKTKISEYDATAANNTDIDSINIAEGMAPSNVNNAIRELMAHLKDMDAGTQALTSPQLTSADIDGGTIDGVTIGGASAGAGTFTNLTATGTTTLAGASTSADITFGDNDKAIFGAGSDLEVFHDGAASYVQDTGTGNLQLRGDNSVALRSYSTTDNYLVGNFNGSVDIYYDNSIKLATSSSGVDITGVLTSDGLTVNTSADGNISTFKGDLNYFYIKGSGADTILSTVGSGGNASNLFFQTDPFVSEVNRMQINKDGDISFYDDQGSSQSFFWSAADESLGLGSTSPDSGRKLHIEGGDTTVGITLKDTAGTQYGIKNDANSFIIRNDSLGLDRLTIDSSGNVGIGTTSPSETVHINSGTANTGLFIESTDANSNLIFRDSGSTANIALGCVGDDFRIQNNNSESMRIDSSGNLLVGTTSTGVATLTSGGGSVISSAGASAIAYQSVNSTDPVLLLNNTGVDGDIATFRKDGATVGSIGAYTSGANNYLTVGNADTGIIFNAVNDAVHPWNITSNAGRDAAIDLGRSSQRFKDLYLSGGVYLGGTGSANKLDDYEEGTWTPVGADAVSGGNTASASTVGGFYTKIGRQVTAHCTLANINTTGMTNGSGFFIQGLPFAHNSTSPRNVTGVVRADKINVDSNCFGMVALIGSGSSTAQLYQNRDNTTDIQILVSALQSGTADLFFSITYDAT